MPHQNLIFFSDLDGTFLTSRKEIPAGNLAALDAIYEAGAQFVPCTGRSLAAIPKALLEHPAARYAVSANGATVTDLSTGEAIHRRDLGHERTRTLLRFADGRDVTFDLFADGRVFEHRKTYDRLAEFAEDPYQLELMRSIRTPFDGETEAFMTTLEHIERISYFWYDPADCAALLEAAQQVPDISVVRSVSNSIEISDARATKGEALSWLCSHLGISRADAVAFGDNINDIPMIEAAGTGVAVANAEDETKSAADAVCGANNNAGVGTFIMQLLAE